MYDTKPRIAHPSDVAERCNPFARKQWEEATVYLARLWHLDCPMPYFIERARLCGFSVKCRWDQRAGMPVFERLH